MPGHRKSEVSVSSSRSCSHGAAPNQCQQCGPAQPSPYQENCGAKVCSLPCDGVNPYALFVKKRSAVVRILAQTTLTTVTAPCSRICDNHACPDPCATNPCPEVPLFNFNVNVGLLQQRSNGFFVANHLIVAPASIALLSPDISTVYNRYPFTAGSQIDPTLLHGDRITRAASFTADVFDVNGSKHAFNYTLELLGVYGVGDLALFWINKDDPANKKLPCIRRCHPFLELGCSRRYRSGLPVYAIGDAGSRSWPARPVAVPAGGLTGADANQQSPLEAISGANNYLQGTVQDIRYVDYGGFAQQELVLVSLPITGFKSGLPLLNQWGQVIAMQTTTEAHNSPNVTVTPSQRLNEVLAPNGDGFVAGPSSFFLGRVIYHLFETIQGNASPFVTPIADSFGSYLLFTHGYLGVSSEVFTGEMYSSYVNAAGLTVPRLSADGVTLSKVGAREVIGLRVRALAGSPTGPDIAPAGVVVPGPATVGTVAFPPSPLAGILTYNDVLIRIDGQALGDLDRQIALSAMTSRRLPTEVVTICYRRNCDDYTKVYSIRVPLQVLPNFMNYPWYKYPTLTVALRDLQPLNGGNFLSLLPVVPPVTGLTSFLPAV